MKIVRICLLLLFLVACEQNTLVLEIKSQGYYVDGEKIINLKDYLEQVNNAESVKLVVLADSTAKTRLVLDAVNFAKKANFKNISLSSVNVQ